MKCINECLMCKWKSSLFTCWNNSLFVGSYILAQDRSIVYYGYIFIVRTGREKA